MDVESLRYEVDGPAAILTLDRPQALNAFTWEMVAMMRRHIATAVADPQVVGIVITGTGRGFCVGLDAAAVEATTGGKPTPAAARGDDGRLPGMFSYLIEQPKPVIAAVNGITAGGGLVLATMCDLRFASAEAEFVSVFARRGLTAEIGVSWTLSRLVGTGNALDILLSSRTIGADEACRMGLVNRVTEPEELLRSAKGYIDDLAEQVSPASMASIKRLVWDGSGMDMGPAFAQAAEETRRVYLREDAREGAAAFLGRRRPRFTRIGEAGST
jgi:enoyl-CoA hydratase/carnithine racemase